MKRWKLWIGLLVAMVIAAAGLTTAYSWWLAEPVQRITPAQTAKVVRAPLTVAVRAYGHLTAPDPLIVNPAISGRLAELNVQQGDRVAAGAVLAKLETEDLQAAVRGAEVALETNRAQLARAKVGPSPEYVGILEAAVTVAQTRLVTAQAAVSGARANLAGARQGATPEEIAIAQRRIEEARNALWGAQASRDAICGRVKNDVGKPECDAAQAATLKAEEGVHIAELQLQQLQAGPKGTTVSSAQAQLDAALGQVQTAEAQVAQAQAELARAKVGPVAEDIAVTQAQVAQGEFALAEAKRRLQSATLTAPAAGTVVAVGANAGQAVSSATPVVTLQDLSALHLEALVNELYVGRVAVGQVAQVRFEADPGRIWEGQVSEVAALPSATSGLANYAASITLVGDATALRAGMGAEVTIIVEQKEAALLAPREALRLDQGRWVIQTYSAGKLLDVPVELGARQGRQVEILSGVEEGQELVTATTALGTEQGDYAWLPFGIMWRVR